MSTTRLRNTLYLLEKEVAAYKIAASRAMPRKEKKQIVDRICQRVLTVNADEIARAEKTRPKGIAQQFQIRLDSQNELHQAAMNILQDERASLIVQSIIKKEITHFAAQKQKKHFAQSRIVESEKVYRDSIHLTPPSLAG